MKTVSITRRVFLVAQPDSEVFVTEFQYLCIKKYCSVLTPQAGDPAKKVKITKACALTALAGSLVNVSDNQYKRIKGACADAYKVSYKYTGTTPSGAPAVPAAAYYTAGTTVTVAAAPTLEGYEFSGWSKTGTFTMPAEAVEITGSWTEVPSEYEVIYDWDESFLAYDSPAAEVLLPNPSVNAAGDTITVSTTPSTDDDPYDFTDSANPGYYNFDGWYKDDQLAPASFTMPSANVELVGKWTKMVKISFTMTGEGPEDFSMNDAFVVPGEDFEIPTPDEYAGWTFDCFFCGSTEYNAGDIIQPEEDLVLDASFAEA